MRSRIQGFTHQSEYDLQSKVVKRLPAFPSPHRKIVSPDARWRWVGIKSLVLYVGTKRIAGYTPKELKEAISAGVDSGMLKDGNGTLRQDQRSVRRLALKLHKTLLAKETGSNQSKVYKQRRRLETKYLNPSDEGHGNGYEYKKTIKELWKSKENSIKAARLKAARRIQ